MERISRSMKLLVTGGHVTPAIAVIEKLSSSVEVVFVGRKYALDQEQTLSFEYKEITKRNIPFINLSAGRLNRSLSLRTFMSVAKIPWGFVRAWQILSQVNPQAVFSFGGYLAFPIAFTAWIRKIPVVTHEQTIRPGLANRLIGRFAQKVFVSFEEASRWFPKAKTQVSGNPVRSAVFKTINKPFDIKKDKPVIYITGGSLGSHSINEHVLALLDVLKKKYIVVHQVGDTKEYRDFEKLVAFEDVNYIPRKHIADEEIGYVYKMCDVVVGRCGANTIFELIALEKPAVLIPLPWSAHQEQQHHANVLKAAGVAQVFVQSKPSAQLMDIIDEVVENQEIYKRRFSNLRTLYAAEAAQTIAREIEAFF